MTGTLDSSESRRGAERRGTPSLRTCPVTGCQVGIWFRGATGVGLAGNPATGVISSLGHIESGPRIPRASETRAGPGGPRSSDPWQVRRGSLEQLSDDELMLAYQKGDLEAFGVLLRRHQRAVFGFALRLLGNRTLAEEVAQESFLRVIKASSRYAAGSSFRGYLYQIVRNLCLDLLRKRSREPQEALAAGNPEVLPESIPNGNPGPESHAGSGQVRLALQRALRKLPPEQREVFLLKEVREMKLQDVARITGTNLNTVKSRLRYALAGLREHLSRQGVGQEDGHDV